MKTVPVLALVLLSCGKPVGSTPPSTPSGGGSGAQVSLRLQNASLGGAARSSGSSTAAQLASLKYLFGEMQMCETLQTTGSGFGAGTNCTPLYDWGKPSGPEAVSGPDALAAYADVAVDVANAASIKNFNGGAPRTVKAGSYNYVTVNWAPYIAVTGSVTVGGATISTKACTLDATTGLCSATTPLTGASAEAVVKSANGGTFFKFQNPFVITDADVAANTQFTIDLVFNPDGALAATTNFSSVGSGNIYWGIITDATAVATGAAVYVPMIQLTPVPKKSGETTSRETYSITLPNNAGTTRVELYFNKSDTTKTIYGVNVLTLIGASNAGSFAQIDNGAKVATIETSASGAITLKGTDGNAEISGLVRGVGGSLSVSTLGGIAAAAATATYTFDGVSDL